MKALIIAVAFLVAAEFVLLAGASVRAQTCQSVGYGTHCNNGLSSQTIGNNGATLQDIGPRTYRTIGHTRYRN